jgi:hypothetical protein
MFEPYCEALFLVTFYSSIECVEVRLHRGGVSVHAFLCGGVTVKDLRGGSVVEVYGYASLRIFVLVDGGRLRRRCGRRGMGCMIMLRA